MQASHVGAIFYNWTFKVWIVQQLLHWQCQFIPQLLVENLAMGNYFCRAACCTGLKTKL